MSRFMKGPVFRFFLAACAVLALASACTSAKARSEEASYAKPAGEPVVSETAGEVAPDQVLVLLEEDAPRKAADKAAKAAGGQVAGGIPEAGIFQLSIPKTDAAGIEAAVMKAAAVEGVSSAAPHGVAWLRMKAAGKACDIFEDDSKYEGKGRFALDNIGYERAFKLVRASGLELAETKVGVVDEQLTGRTGELARVGLEKPVEAKFSRLRSHGDQVTGIIGADPGNGGHTGIASGIIGGKLKMGHSGLEWGLRRVDGATEATDPTLMEHGTGENRGLYAVEPLVAVYEQVKGGATVVNCSWGNDNTNAEMLAVYRRFFERMAKDHADVVFVCASPNSGMVNGSNDYPSGMKLPNVISVGCMDVDGTARSARAEGDGEVSLMAPAGIFGNEVERGDEGQIEAIRLDEYGSTSYSAPQVAAAAAVLHSLDPDLSGADIKRILVETAGDEMTSLDGKKAKIPASHGGRSLALDRAVLRVINDRRKKADPDAKALTLDDADKLFGVKLSAKSDDGKEWQVYAAAEAVLGKTTDLTISTDGQGAIGGKKTQTVAGAERASWSVTLGEDAATVHVKRTEGGCSRVELKPASLAGRWKWATWYTSQKWTPETGVSVDDWEWKPGGVFQFEFIEQGGGFVVPGWGRNFPVTFDGTNVSLVMRDDTTGWSMSCSGKLEGDRIVGTVTFVRPDTNAGPLTKTWEATRLK